MGVRSYTLFMQQSVTTLGQHANVVIDCASSDGLEPLIAWVRTFPKGAAVAIRLPHYNSDHSPAMRRVTGELLSMGCSVTLRRQGCV